MQALLMQTLLMHPIFHYSYTLYQMSVFTDDTTVVILTRRILLK